MKITKIIIITLVVTSTFGITAFLISSATTKCWVKINDGYITRTTSIPCDSVKNIKIGYK